MPRPIPEPHRAVILRLRELYGASAIMRILEEKRATKGGRKRDLPTNKIGVWAAIEIRKIQEPDKSSHVITELAREMEKKFPDYKPSSKWLRNQYDEAKRLIEANDQVRGLVQGLLDDLRRDAEIEGPRRRFFPCRMKHSQKGQFIGPKIDTHAFDRTKQADIFFLGKAPMVIGVTRK